MAPRPSSPRLSPLERESASEAAREQLDRHATGGRVLNIFRTLAHHPDLLRRWSVFATHVLNKSTLSPRERELAILRTGWLCGSEYEWGQHVLIGLRDGLDDGDVRRLADGPEAAGWTPGERDLLRAVDQLHEKQRIEDDTWQRLAERLSTQQLLDLVFAVGQYTLVCMALRTLGVERDAGVPGFEDTAGKRPAS
jgi:alkylhydroperoxidase family enzyme